MKGLEKAFTSSLSTTQSLISGPSCDLSREDACQVSDHLGETNQLESSTKVVNDQVKETTQLEKSTEIGNDQVKEAREVESTKELEKSNKEIGIIGFGEMGKLYAKAFLRAGWKHVHVCDLPEKYPQLLQDYQGTGMTVHKDGYSIVRRADFVMFSVEAASIDSVVAKYGPAMKLGAIACGQTSVKFPEIQAFEKYLPNDVHIITCHSLHGPTVNPKGQPLVLINHRSNDAALAFTLNLLASLESKFVHLSAEEHDKITADTQAITHVAFMSMGMAWKTQSYFPWENPQYIGGIENAKILMTLRIYGNKWHVYAGLALFNPYALPQVEQYARSVSDLFKLMIQEKRDEFRNRILEARKFVFQNFEAKPILLSDELLNEFSLSAIPLEMRVPVLLIYVEFTSFLVVYCGLLA